MTIEEADKIMRIWGKYLEYCSGRFMQIFCRAGGKIPESMLPYPKPILEEALNYMDRHYHETNNQRGVELMRETMILLELYGDDDAAIQQAGINFSDTEQRKHIVSEIKDWQQTWITTQQ